MKKIGIFIYPGCQSMDVVGPAQVFASTNECDDSSHYEITLFSFEKGAVKTDGGFSLVAECDWHEIGALDTLIIPGGKGSRRYLERTDISDWICERFGQCRRIVSVCTGAFWLAQAGLLNGKKATTHWRHCDRLANQYPKVDVQADAIYLHQGKVSTSAGVTAGLDLCLSLVEQDLGYAISVEVAQELLVFYQRPGGQAQFRSLHQARKAGDKRVAGAIRFIQSSLNKDINTEDIAESVGLSSRQLTRVFQQELAVSPSHYLLQSRLKLATDLLTNTELSMSQVAEQSGLASADNLRNVFLRHFGVNPKTYRAQFQPNSVAVKNAFLEE